MVSNINYLSPSIGYRLWIQHRSQNDSAVDNRGYLNFRKNQMPGLPFGSSRISTDPGLGSELDLVNRALASLSQLNQQIDYLDEKSRKPAGKENTNYDLARKILYPLSIIPSVRRMNSVPENLENGNWQRPVGLAALTAISSPGDFREMLLAGKEAKNIFSNGGALSFAKNEYQHRLSFFKGTFVEKLASKLGWNIDGLLKMDKTLYDTKFGNFVRKTFDISEPETIKKQIGGNTVKTFRFSQGGAKGIIGRSLLRFPVLGGIIASALEVPAIVKSADVEGSFMDKVKSVFKQTCKSAGFVGLVNGLIAVGGAVLFPYGYAASLVGMAIGSTLGIKASDFLNKQIDKAFA